METAFKVAVDLKNDAGGIESLGGAEVEVVTADNQGKQELGSEAEQQLIDEGAVAISGCMSSPVTFAATAIAEQEQVPHVIDVAVASKILQERDMNYVYRVQPPASAMARDFVPGVKRVADQFDSPFESASIIYVNNDFGVDIKNQLDEYLPEGGIEVVERQAVELGQANMDTEATRLKDADADAVIVVNYSTAGTQTFAALDQVDYRPDLITGCASGTMTSPNELEQIGPYINGGLGTNYALNPNAELTQEIKRRFKDRAGKAISASHAMSFASAKVIVEGIEQAGSTDPEDINEAIKNIRIDDHPMAMGTIAFQENGENENNLAPLHQVQELENHLVYPEQFASKNPNHPNPSA